jgi:hypothetical protein
MTRSTYSTNIRMAYDEARRVFSVASVRYRTCSARWASGRGHSGKRLTIVTPFLGTLNFPRSQPLLPSRFRDSCLTANGVIGSPGRTVTPALPKAPAK